MLRSERFVAWPMFEGNSLRTLSRRLSKLRCSSLNISPGMLSRQFWYRKSRSSGTSGMNEVPSVFACRTNACRGRIVTAEIDLKLCDLLLSVLPLRDTE